MLAISIGKIIKNKWLFLCMFIACVFSVALIASIPAYEYAINTRMLQRELRELEMEHVRPPLMHTIAFEGPMIAQYMDGSVAAMDNFVHNMLIPRFGLPVDTKRLTLFRPNVAIYHVSPYDDMARINRGGVLYSRGLFDHVELIAGRFPGETDDSGVIEVVVSREASHRAPFMLDALYALDFTRVHTSVSTPDGWVRIRVVGIVQEIDPNDPFWRVRPMSLRDVYTTYESYIRTFHVGEESRFQGQWQTAFDHRVLVPDDVQPILDLLREANSGSLTNIRFLRGASAREAELAAFMWVLQVPILALLVFFTIMLSGLILDHDKIEIALLYSRGAKKWHVFSMYAIQTLLLAGAGMAAGIPLSLWLCRVMGSAAGFLEFAGRAPLDVTMTNSVLLYGAAGAGLFAVSTLLPILFSGTGGVVAQRRAKAARVDKPFFEKYYLDLVLVGVSIYGYLSYQSIRELLLDTGAVISEFAIDPLIFLISTFFFVGFAMLFTRLYPYIVRLLFSVGKPFWPPAIYASLSAARSKPRSRYIMLFIIMTASVGVYAAAAARTINQNRLDQAMHNVGADIVIRERWPFIDPNLPRYTPEGDRIIPPYQDLLFIEPSFEKWGEAEGVALATKVYRNDRAVVRTTRAEATRDGRIRRPAIVRDVNVMAIYPDEFAQVAWWRGDMFSYHLNYKMNAMSLNPNVVLLCRELMAVLGVAHGDYIYASWANNPDETRLYVYDAVDFFPTFNPVSQDNRRRAQEFLIVMNYELVKTEFRIEPYEVWIMREEGASSAGILQHYIDNEISMLWVRDAGVAMAAVRNDPLLLSMNGFLTLSFVMTLAVTGASFLVFWVFELRSRRLQISIMRSMGMSRRGVAAMLLWEQALLSLLPLVAGFVLGEVGLMLFVPMFEMGGGESPLPFRVFSQAADSLRVGAIVLGSIVIAIIMLWWMAARINVSQTLKLGEE